MNQDKKHFYIGNGILLGILLLVLFLPNIELARIFLAIELSIFAIWILHFIKKRTLLSIYKKQVVWLMVLVALVYVIVYYLSGLHFGFYQSLTPFSWPLAWKEMLPTLVILAMSEMIRYVFLAQNHKGTFLFSFGIFVLLEIVLRWETNSVTSFYGFVDAVGIVIFPSITNTLLFHYLSRKYGVMPNIWYRSILAMYPYLIPYTPATPTSIVAFAKLVVPLLIWSFLFILYEKKKYSDSRRKYRFRRARSFICLFLMTAMMMLISCQFTYGILLVGSESMTGALNKGDGVIYEQYEGQLLHKEDIIIFEKEGKKIIHRVVDIQQINGELRYYTKGDANDNMDVGYITQTQIVGIVHMRILYIGYPTIWLKESFAKNRK